MLSVSIFFSVINVINYYWHPLINATTAMIKLLRKFNDRICIYIWYGHWLCKASKGDFPYLLLVNFMDNIL